MNSGAPREGQSSPGPPFDVGPIWLKIFCQLDEPSDQCRVLVSVNFVLIDYLSQNIPPYMNYCNRSSHARLLLIPNFDYETKGRQ